MRFAALICILILLGGVVVAEPVSWPRWRGPNGNGVSLETGWNAKALEGGAKVLWTADIGAGYSNIAISGGRLYTVGSTDFNHLQVFCRDAVTGRVIWQKMLENIVDFDDPMASPCIDGDRLYVAARNGTILCLRTADGSVVWQKLFGIAGRVDVKTEGLGYGMAGSPVVDGAFLLIDTNRSGVALDKMTGALAWDSGPVWGCKVYASPIIFDLDGKRTAILLGPTGVNAVDVATGNVVWSHPHGETVELLGDPIIGGDLVYFASLSASTVIDRRGPRVVWSNDSLRGGTATPVLLDGYLYGFQWDRPVASGDWNPAKHEEWQFQCVDLKTGKVAWARQMRYGSLIAADGKLILLDLNGNLTIAKATPDGFTPLCSADVLAGADRPRLFPTPPVLCDGRIYVRNYAGDLICIDARK
jgi:outer membrane protein assembly factor BamB